MTIQIVGNGEVGIMADISIKELIEEMVQSDPHKIILSGGRGEYRKVVFERKIIGGKRCFQIERYTEKQVFHQNIDEGELEEALAGDLQDGFRQINMFSAREEWDVKISKKGKIAVNKRHTENKLITVQGNNRRKKYILEEGMDIPVFTHLGIFTKDGKVVHSMYDKFKQINRFAEIVDNVMKSYNKPSINIVDFGCGKSYLTFIVYYYLHEVKGLDVHITGLDLKEQVIKDCNALAEQFGYTGLKFELGDINGYKTDVDVDMVMTLHACDVATDYALYNAICWNAQYILSVPCCQHELNKQMHSDELAALTRYGIIKERIAALATDSIRGHMLEACGYKTDITEFIDIAHSPKNLLIRAVKKNVSPDRRKKALKDAEALCEEFGFRQTLMEMIKADGRI
jgi:SAM-dependent methyltransferase